MLAKNAKVYMASRNKQKAEEAIAALKLATGREAIFLPVDLADLASVKKGAEEFLKYVVLDFGFKFETSS